LSYKREVKIISNKQVVLSIYSPSTKSYESNKITYLELYKPHESDYINNEYPEYSEKEKMNFYDYLDNLEINLDDIDNHDSSKKRPLIIFSPGLKMDRDSSMFIIEKLISKNYTVITIGHSYETPITYLPDGEIIKSVLNELSPQEKLDLILERSSDIDLVINKIKSGELEISSATDKENIILIGHSFGGAASYKSACSNNSIKGLVLWDASLQYFDEISDYKKLSIPVLNFRRGLCNYDDEIEKFIKDNKNLLTKEEFEFRLSDRKRVSRLQFDAQMRLYASTDSTSHYIKLIGSEHMSFTDYALLQSYEKDKDFLFNNSNFAHNKSL
jgi:hypothetical protein